MEIKIRKERPADVESVFNLIEQAFEHETQSDHQEQFLVDKLRASDAFISELSLVAERNGELLGYVLLTKIIIKSANRETTSLALGPVAVLPGYQGEGIGSRLIKEAHEKAKALGYGSIVVLGHEHYYPRFGYQMAERYGINLPFDVPAENCMVIELAENALKGVRGIVEYAPAFYE